MDIVTAFLNGTLKETIYMLQPPGFSSPGKEDLVCRLKKSIYGLKQSPRTWYEEVDSSLQWIRCKRSSLDPNLYLLQEDGKTIILLLVDDHLITRNYEELIADLKQQLKSKYEMKYLGPVKRYLGVDFHSLQSGIFLHQKLYADQIVLDYDMQDCCSVSTPLPKELELSAEINMSAWRNLCLNTRRSTGGYVYQIAGGPITWSSNRQPTISCSTTKAEYWALSDKAQEGFYLKRLIEELQQSTLPATKLHCKDSDIKFKCLLYINYFIKYFL